MSNTVPMNINVGDRVQHRAWLWYAEVADIQSPVFWTSMIGIRIDGETNIRQLPVFSLICDTNDFIYDWSDVDEDVQREPESSG